MGNRSGWSAMVLATAFLASCQTTIIQRSGGARILTGSEMDEVRAGSAVAVNDAAAHALGSKARADVLVNVSAYSGAGPIASTLFLNYANSRAIASASGDELAETGLSSHASVLGANGGASIGVTAAGVGTSRAQVTAQFYGMSANRADIVFGSVAAVACCGSGAGAQVKVGSSAGGPYSRELRAAPVSDAPGQVQNRVDIAVVSSALPTVDPAQVLAAGAPARAFPKY
jgi:hypothetical protein